MEAAVAQGLVARVEVLFVLFGGKADLSPIQIQPKATVQIFI
jgi:hypothetical protein